LKNFRSFAFRRLMPVFVTVLAASLSASAQRVPMDQASFASSDAGMEPGLEPGGSAASTRPAEQIAHPYSAPYPPFSRTAAGVSVSPLGVGFEATTNLNRHFNFRSNGSYFKYTANNIQTQGFNVAANIKMSSARASVDYYPFHNGFRLTPGVMFYNGNHATTSFTPMAGTSFSLGDHTYYSASGANAIHGTGAFGLGNGRPALTMTTGWGNQLPRRGHLSFPVEIGAAFIKQPTASLNLSGYVCDANGLNCVNVATDPTAQADLAQQVKDYQNDINPLKTYPIVSFGVAYNFRSRSSQLR
jgi:hypothetical protein